MCGMLLFVIAGLSAPALKDPPPRAEDLVGTWQPGRVVRDGKPLDLSLFPDAQFVPMVFRADGGLVYDSPSGGRDDQSYRVDVKDHLPTIHLDLAPARAGGGVWVGIWQVSGDTLTLAVAPEGSPRPTAFQSNTGSRVHLTEFKRVQTGK
jgi:uncharacterized protein (TIGR03067 family)